MCFTTNPKKLLTKRLRWKWIRVVIKKNFCERFLPNNFLLQKRIWKCKLFSQHCFWQMGFKTTKNICWINLPTSQKRFISFFSPNELRSCFKVLKKVLKFNLIPIFSINEKIRRQNEKWSFLLNLLVKRVSFWKSLTQKMRHFKVSLIADLIRVQ